MAYHQSKNNSHPLNDGGRNNRPKDGGGSELDGLPAFGGASPKQSRIPTPKPETNETTEVEERQNGLDGPPPVWVASLPSSTPPPPKLRPSTTKGNNVEARRRTRERAAMVDSSARRRQLRRERT